MDWLQYLLATRQQRRLAQLMARQIEMEHPEVARSIQRRRLITVLVTVGLLLGIGLIASIQQESQAKHSPTKKKRARKPATPAPEAPEAPSPDAPELPSPQPK